MARTKRPYFVERETEPGACHWQPYLNGNEYSDKAEALAAMKTCCTAGSYRVVAVVWEGKVETENTIKVKLLEA
jgi:hypothetical protein